MLKTANTIASITAITVLNIEAALFAGFFLRYDLVLAGVSALLCIYALVSRSRIQKDIWAVGLVRRNDGKDRSRS